MDHPPGFLKLGNEGKLFVKEITLDEARRRLAANPKCVLLDVREDSEWQKGHAVEATHLGKGVLERDLEKLHPSPDTEILMYCGGGFRSILTAANARRLGLLELLLHHQRLQGHERRRLAHDGRKLACESAPSGIRSAYTKYIPLAAGVSFPH
jgi:rhodanese-related sulfurtransferase